MLRLAAIFIAVCMVLIAGSVSAVLHLFFGLTGAESAMAGLAALTGLLLFNTVTTRLHDRNDVGDQIADLSRVTADLAKQMAEFKHSLAAAESKLEGAVNRAYAAVDPVTSEIGELGLLVSQLAETVTAHEAALAGRAAADAAAAGEPASIAAPVIAPTEAAPAAAAGAGFKSLDAESMRAGVREAIEAGRLDIYLQPVVTLPQRKIRFYEALTRMRTAGGEQVMAEDFVPHAEAAGLMPKVDNLLLFRSVQVLRRLLLKDREIGVFCNVSRSTLQDPEFFAQFSDFMDANRALAPALIFEFRQDAYRAMGPPEYESLASLASRGFRFSMDHVTDLRMEPRELSERGFRFLKVSGAMLVRSGQAGSGDIHPADLSDLLARYHIDLIAERIESESVVVDLLDFDVRFGQGFLFSPPRPVRVEAIQANGGDAAAKPAGNAAPAAHPPGIEAPNASSLVSRMGVVA
ncbi:MAG TPA: EAL domain-containing protein [Xanthobacteraceae bacterium]|nr:EAL domain-containing protein [Xanthobacteraceae bacterium]